MPIPDYGLKDPVTGQPILSRDRKYNHLWFSSKHVDYYDNQTSQQMNDGIIAPSQSSPSVFTPSVRDYLTIIAV
jgi:hypothetical protein